MLERSKSVQCGIGSKEITGCRIALYPMTDRFVDFIMQGIEKTDTSRVWMHTDSLGTLIRGQMDDVVNTSMLMFANAYQREVHMSSSLTFSKGCPGDVEADYLEGIESLDSWIRSKNDHEQCEATFSFYSFGNTDYMEHIYHVIDMSKQQHLYSEKSHYSTVIQGSIFEIFQLFKNVLMYADAHLNHFVIEANLSVNSPSKKEKL